MNNEVIERVERYVTILNELSGLINSDNNCIDCMINDLAVEYTIQDFNLTTEEALKLIEID